MEPSPDGFQVFLSSLAAAAVATVVTLAFVGVGVRLLRERLGVTPASVAPHAVTPTPPQLPHLDPDELAHLRGELAAVRAEWKAHQKQLDAYLEAFEDLEESVERRRRRTAASRSKLEAAEAQPEENPNDREAIRQRARARGFRV